MSLKTEATFFSKFLVVGVLATVVDFTLSNLFLVFIETGNSNNDLRIATTISYIIAVLFNFMLNRFWIYRASQGQTQKQMIQFYIVYGTSYFVRLLILSIAFPIWQTLVGQVLENNVDTLASNLALATAIGCVMFYNFGVNRLWTFGDVKSQPSPSAE